MTTTTRNIEIRLVGHQSPDGQLLAADAVALIAAFKDVTYRLTRAVAERPGLGRTDASLEKLATVRVALRSGSTRVVFTVGDDAALVDPLADAFDDAFYSIVTGMETNEVPPHVTDSVSDAVDGLIGAMSKAAPQVMVTVPRHQASLLTMADVSRAPWQRSSGQPARQTVVHGVLEMVDLRSSRFRLRDSAGNGIDLIDVVEPRAAAALVGRNVQAHGPLTVGDGGQRHRMVGPHILEEEGIEKRLGLAGHPTIHDLMVQAASAPPPPPLELSDEEVGDFLAAVHGG